MGEFGNEMSEDIWSRTAGVRGLCTDATKRIWIAASSGLERGIPELWLTGNLQSAFAVGGKLPFTVSSLLKEKRADVVLMLAQQLLGDSMGGDVHLASSSWPSILPAVVA